MEAFLHPINAVGLILMLIAVGFVAGKTKMMKAEHKSFVVKYLINIAVPAMCIANVFERLPQLDIANPLLLVLPPVVSMLITLGIALVAAKLFKLTKRRFGAFVVMGAFSNSIFIGLPMCKELFGEIAIPYVIFFYIANTLMFWTVGAALIQRSSDATDTKMTLAGTVKKLITPPLVSLIVSIIVLSFGVTLPHIVSTFCGYLGDTVSPLALLYVGFVMSETKFKEIRFDFSFIFALVMRFVIAPIVTLFVCRIFGIAEMALNVFIIESAMPVMTQCVIVSAAYGGDETYAASAMTVSTIASVLAIPIWYLILT